MPKKPTPKRVSNRRKNMAPDQYRRRGTVYHERLRRGKDFDEGKGNIHDDTHTTDIYHVQTDRRDTVFNHTVSLNGEVMRLPGKVVERLISQRDGIIKEGRSLAAKTRTAQRSNELSQQAQADQDAALEAEMQRDLKELGGQS